MCFVCGGSTTDRASIIDSGVSELEVTHDAEALRARVAQLETQLATTTTQLMTRLEAVTAERDKLHRAYEQLKEQLELLRRRIFVAKAERIDVTQLEMEFAETQAKLDALGVPPSSDDGESDDDDDDIKSKGRSKPKGRRNLRNMAVLREERIELLDKELEARVAEGTVIRTGFEESCRLAYQRGGAVRIVVARATYKTTDDDGTTTMLTVPRPRELLRRCLLAPSALAHVLYAKYAMGLPLFRLETWLGKDGLSLDRGSMSRWSEDAGASLGAIVEACAKEAMSAFCLCTDATGVSIQPEPRADKGRQPCKKGHFFVVLADRDHVFFEYKPKHTSAAVCDMFRGYSGFIQSDAHAIYDALHRGDAVEAGADPPIEVGCWAHCRRKYWEAAVAKHSLGREGLLRIRAIFQRDERLDDLPPDRRRELRQQTVKPLVDDFFGWATHQYSVVHHERGLVTSALGYSVRQEAALRRFLGEGRLAMTNNSSERALRPIASGRRAWLFFGSDDHATAAANLFSLIASCKLHQLDAEAYLRDVIRVMPYWPSDRYLELAPKYWAATRSRLDPEALMREVGPIAVPPCATPTEQPTPG